LASVPEFHAAVTAINAVGTPYQVTFVFPDLIPSLEDAYISERATPEEIDAIRERLGLDRPLAEILAELVPPYELFVFADMRHGQSELALVGLVYKDEINAQQAADRIIDQMANYASRPYGMPLLGVLDERDADVDPPRLVNVGRSGMTVMLLPIIKPLPSSDPEMSEPPSLIYHLLSDMLLGRDFGWLAFRVSD
jgi:hypothetical protein